MMNAGSFMSSSTLNPWANSIPDAGLTLPTSALLSSDSFHRIFSTTQAFKNVKKTVCCLFSDMDYFNKIGRLACFLWLFGCSSSYEFDLLLSLICSVMFLLNSVLLLHPLLQPNGENGSENKQQSRTFEFDLILRRPSPAVGYLSRFLWTPACVSSPAGWGPGRPGRWLPLTGLWEWGRGRSSAEGWSWCSRFQPQTPDVQKGSAESLCWCSVRQSKTIRRHVGSGSGDWQVQMCFSPHIVLPQTIAQFL